MRSMFDNADSFNRDISGWDVSSVTGMNSMFASADSFNRDISGWNVSSVTGMRSMFFNAASFNQPLDSWDVSSVTDMGGMFLAAASFNGNVSGWDVSSVTDMNGMFNGAASFNQPLDSWDVSSVTGMRDMFDGAASFNQNLGEWYVTLDDSSIPRVGVPGVVGSVSAQNQPLRVHDPAYGIGAGGDSTRFGIVSGRLLNMTSADPDRVSYKVNITASGDRVFENGNNWRMVDVTVNEPFITTWQTATAGESITIPVGGAAGTYTVYWGDGTPPTTASGDQAHEYATPGNHTVSIFGDFPRIYLDGNPTNAPKILSIGQWGDIKWQSMDSAFRGAANMTYDATDSPDLSRVTDMGGMFSGAASFNGNVSGWDVSSVTDMRGMFVGAVSFNQPLDSWDVSSVTDMNGMFIGAASFNGNVSGWDVSSVTDMGFMFYGAASFNQDISGWDVSSVTDMGFMFYGAASFNQPLDSWDVSSVTGMDSMFYRAASFNGNVSGWDVSSVTGMDSMFYRAASFNGNVSGWDVSSVTGMDSMFYRAASFNQPLDSWDVSSVTGMDGMFSGAASFNQPLDSWDVSSVTDMDGMFVGAASFNQNLGEWYVTLDDSSIPRVDVPGVVGSVSAQNQPLRGHGPAYGIGTGGDSARFGIVSGILLNMTSADPDRVSYKVNITASGDRVFENGNNWRMVDVTVNEPFITTWQTATASESITIPVGNATGTYTVDWGDGTPPTIASGDQAHEYATPGSHTVSISGDFTRIYLDGNSTNAPKIRSIGQWGGIKWQSMDSAFGGATNMAYNATDSPDLSRVTDMGYMFHDAVSFNGDLSGWDVSSVTDMGGMFFTAISFNQPLDSWDVSSVTGMRNMFEAAASFNQPLDSWDVSSVTDMGGMFGGANSFNQPLDSWNVSSVTGMRSMFLGAAFNQPLDSWDVSSVTSMRSMFLGAAFNQPLDSWDVSSVTGMRDMFNRAASFNGNVSGWDVSSVTDMNGMFSGADSFNQPLDSWDVSSVTDMNGMFFGAASFNQPLDSWDVSSATDMRSMFDNAASFNQNLGEWYVTLDDSSIPRVDVPGVVGSVSAQNQPLRGHGPAYGIGAGGDPGHFEIVSGRLLNMTSADPDRASYKVNITASGDRVFEDGNNWRMADIAVKAGGSRPFITTWQTATAGESITIPVGNATGTYTINWGDGAVSAYVSGDQAHEYAAPGSHTVSISGDFPRIYLNGNSTNAPKILSIGQWGDIKWQSMASAFNGTTNMVYNATDSPDLSRVTDMNGMFWNAASFNGNVSGWDVSSVTGMRDMFIGAASFNGNVSGWDVSSVADMGGMFSFTAFFNQPLDSWDVSSVTDMNHMFVAADSFNQPLDSWNVSSVTDMNHMFVAADSFNQPLDSWNVSSVTDMDGMFSGADSFNQDISGWDVSSVTDMRRMFDDADSFNQPLDSWNVSSVTDMDGMFSGADSFNQDISGWDVSSVTDMRRMFDDADSFNRPLDSWNVSSVADMGGMFSFTASFNQPLGSWDVSSVTDMSFMFDSAASFNQNLGEWYVTLNSTSISRVEVPGVVGSVSAQNQPLRGHGPAYGIGAGGDSGRFGIVSGSLLNMASADPDQVSYKVSITAPGGNFGTNNHRILDIRVTGSGGNADPVLQAVEAKSVNELATLSFTATATDGDGDALTFSLAGTPPPGASINSTSGAFSWTPTERQDGMHTITVLVSDGSGGTDSEDVTVTVAEVNEDPVLNPIDPKSVNKLEALTFTATASDGDVIDGVDDALEFSLTGTTPSGASINSTSGAFSWTPTASQVGEHTVTVQVKDGGNATDSEDVAVTVTESNENPVLGAVDPKSVNELATLSFTATATDGDGDTLTFSLAGTPPPGASINSTSGAFSWTPSESQDGVRIITIQVEDGNGGSDSRDVTVTINEVNRSPVATPPGTQTVNELLLLSFTVTASDPDVINGVDDAIDFALGPSSPPSASINPATGLFSWMPTEQQDGMYDMVVQVSDGDTTIDVTFPVTVSEVNQAPVLNPIGPKSANKLESLTFTATASDGDVIGGTADSLEFSLTGTPPSGASINSTSGAFFWTPTAGQVGEHTVTVQVEDGTGATDSEAVTVTVGESNENPVLGAIGPKSVNELAALTFTAAATDGDSDALTFTLAGTPPSGASINSTSGAFSWTPSESQDGTHTITVQVEDGNGGSDSETITVTVSEVNADPVLASVGSKSVDELESLTFTATASDGDAIGGTADSLEFSLGAGAPTGASITSGGAFSWMPTEQQDGTHSITVRVSDGAGATASETVAVTVSEVNVAPVLEEIGPMSANPLEPLAFNATATDADIIGGTPDSLEFSLGSNAPAGAAINSTTGSFSWTPTAGQVGTHTVTVQVEDGTGATDSEAVTVTVGESNENPVLGAIGAKSVDELAELAFTATATDGDSDALTFTLAGTPPPGASINSTSGAFSWTPSESQDGTHTITIQVEDGNGGSDSEAVTVTVSEVNADPVLASVGSKSVDELEPLTFTATASDGDVIGGTADSLEFSLGAGAPTGASITSGGAFSWTPTASQIGTHTITIQVEDGAGAADSEAVTVKITADSVDPPTTRSGGGGSRQAHALAIDLGTVRSTGLASTPQEIVRYLGTFDPDEPIQSTGDAGRSDPPLAINGSAYLLGGTHNTLEPQALMSGEPTDITFTVYSTADIVHFAVNMSQQGADAGPPASYTLIRFSDGAVSTVDPGGLIADADVAITRVPGAAYKYRVQADVEFANVTGLTDMVITSENARGASTTVHVASAFEVLAPAAAQAAPDPPAPEPDRPPDQEPPVSPAAALRMWAGFGPVTMGDAGLLAALGLDYPDAVIPAWVKTGLAPLAINNGIAVDEFTTALEYVLGAMRDGGTAGSRPADPDAAAPTVTSIERSDPAGETTSAQTLVFAVTFSEGVTGVDAGDFALSPDGGFGQFTRARTPGLAIPDNAAAVSDAITVPGFGTATSVSVSVDIAHPYIDDLTVELVAPDGAARTLHDRSGGNADGIVRTYTPDFGGTGIAGDWALRASDGAPGDAGTLNGWTLTVGHGGAGGSVTGLAGSGSRYLVTASAPREGTYSLDVVRDSGIADVAGNQLANTAPTGPDHAYAVVADTTAPTVTSIERSDPAGETTSAQTLVFEVTFSEGVTGVDAGDFALSPDSGFGQFTRAKAPGLAIPDNAAAVSDAITVPGFGTATSVSVSVDIAHPYIDDLTVELVAPDGAARTLHDRSGGNADGIVRTYTPDFGGTGIAGDWALRASDGAPGDAGTLNGWTLTVGHGGAGGSVTGLAGSGSRYLVTVSAPREGTYNLDVVRDSGIADAAGNALADTAPTGPDHAYTVVADTTAPTVTSIERSDPAGETTSAQTLVFEVTFSEGVTGVDAGDFALSPDSGFGQFTRAKAPGLAIPDNAAAVSDAITVPGFGTATSVSVSVDIAHPYIDDLTVELVAPDGAARTLHDRSGGNADGIVRTYTPDFGGTGIAGDWALRASDGAPGDAGTLNGWTLTVGHGGAGGSVTGLAGSGSRYLVTVSAPREGTYNLDVVRDSGIADAAGNALADTAPTGPDHAYTVVADTTAPTVTSIERSDPAGETTSAQTLVFAVTFSEDVTGVDAGDFALSPDGGFGQFTQTSTPALAIPDNAAAISDAITVPGFGTATSVSVSVDIAHPFIGDLVVELVAPDGAARTLHDRSGGNADGIVRTYAPDFGGTGIAGDWTLRVSDGAPGDAGTMNGWTLTVGHGGAGGSVTGLAGSGSQYLVTASAPQGGTYSLDVVRDSGIADVAGNPLAGAAGVVPY